MSETLHDKSEQPFVNPSRRLNGGNFRKKKLMTENREKWNFTSVTHQRRSMVENVLCNVNQRQEFMLKTWIPHSIFRMELLLPSQCITTKLLQKNTNA